MLETGFRRLLSEPELLCSCSPGRWHRGGIEQILFGQLGLCICFPFSCVKSLETSLLLSVLGPLSPEIARFM